MICIKVICHARKVMHFAAQAQGFVKVTHLRHSWDLQFQSLEVLNRAVTLGFAAARWLEKLRFCDKAQVKRRF